MDIEKDNLFGKEVKRLRQNAGLTQQQLADAIDTSVTTISGVEIGRHKPRKRLIRNLANYFRISKESLALLVGGIENLGFTIEDNRNSKNELKTISYILQLDDLTSPNPNKKNLAHIELIQKLLISKTITPEEMLMILLLAVNDLAHFETDANQKKRYEQLALMLKKVWEEDESEIIEVNNVLESVDQ